MPSNYDDFRASTRETDRVRRPWHDLYRGVSPTIQPVAENALAMFEATVAADPAYFPLGAPVFLTVDRGEANGLWIAQDTGGAIKGAVRADFFWGYGDEAGAMAGKMKQRGEMWVLLPKGMALPEPPPVEAQPVAAAPVCVPAKSEKN